VELLESVPGTDG